MKHFIICSFAFFLFLNTSFNALACICFTEKPCFYMADAGVIFIGTAVKTTSISEWKQMTRFKVEKSFAGVNEPEVDVSGGGTSCDYYFSEGSRYLVFASRMAGGKTLYTDICMGTKLEREAENLGFISYLEKEVSKPSGGIFEGILGIWNIGKPLSKVRVVLESETNKIETFTKKTGKFTLKGIPQGEYTLRIYTPLKIVALTIYEMENLKKNEWKIEIKNSACYRAKFGHFRNTK